MQRLPSLVALPWLHMIETHEFRSFPERYNAGHSTFQAIELYVPGLFRGKLQVNVWYSPARRCYRST